jgi:MoaA/NifB/PqqE/SkfB family radical SAM enzyme
MVGDRRPWKAIRKGLDWARVRGSLKRLPRAVRDRIKLATTVTRLNFNELDDLAAFAKEFEIPVITLQQFSPCLPFHNQLILSEYEWNELQNDIARLRNDPNLSGITINDFTYQPKIKPDAQRGSRADALATIARVHSKSYPADRTPLVAMQEAVTLPFKLPEVLTPIAKDADPEQMEPAEPEEEIKFPACLAAWATTYVLSNGNVLPCCSIAAPLGSLVEDRFDEIWSGPAYQALRLSLLHGTNLSPRCVGCTDSTRFAGLPEVLLEIRRRHPSRRFEAMFDLAELPTPLREIWTRLSIPEASSAKQSAQIAQPQATADHVVS